MTQPKRTASRLLSALLGLIMLLSLLPTVTLAAERTYEELKAITVTSDIEEIAQFRHPVETPTFKETTGKPVKFKTDPEWWRYNETTGKYERYTGKTFKEGKYKFFIVATITGSDYDQYRFANQVTATVNGEKWMTTGSAIDPGRKLSRILMVSPEYTIEGRQLVNRVVLTSNMEEILAQKDRLDTPSIRVRSAFTTTGTKVSCVDTDVSAYDWQVKDPDDVFWFKAWDPDDFRPGVQRGAYYRIIFKVRIKGWDRDTYALVEPDQLTVTLDGTECRIVGDVEKRYGEEMEVLTREYYTPRDGDLQPITSIDLKTNTADLLRANNTIRRPTITETNNKMVFRADSYKDGWQCSYRRVLPNGGGYSFNWSEPTTSYFEKGKYYRYGAVLTVKDWEHWKLGAASDLTITVDGERIPGSYIERIDDLHVFVYSKEHRADERTWIREVDATSNAASIVKLGGTVKSPTITFNDGDQDLYVDGSKWGDWLRWEGSSWRLYEKSTFEPGEYRYRTYFRVGNWEDYEFPATAATINNLTVKWDGVKCDRPVDYTPSQICVTSPAYIVNDLPTITSVTITSNIKDILKVGGEVKTPTITTEEASYVYTQPVWTYEWERKIGPGNSDADWETYQKSTFEAGTYRYNIFVKIRNPEEFKLAGKDELTVKWDGAVCSTFHHSDRSVWVESGEYTISSAPADVKLVGAKAVSNGIQVTWKAADGAAQYRVYRKAEGVTKWSIIAHTTDTSYVDKTAEAGVKYTYTVRGIAADGKTLSPSYDGNGVSATIPKTNAPANVTLTGAKVVTGGIQVTWKAASGATKYRVYRKDATNTGWRVLTSSATGTSYVDKTAKAGSTYTYTVRGIAKDGKTLSSSYDKIGVSAVIAPAKVVLVSAKADSAGVLVTWQKAAGAHSYQVFRKTANTGWQRIAKNIHDTEWKDIDAVKGTKYFYTVRAVADDGATRGAYDKTGKPATVTKNPTTPADVTLGKAVAGKSGITVTWSYAADARTYRVYRKAAGENKWTIVAKNAKGKSWTDKNVTKGVKYTYTVRGVNANGVLSSRYNGTGVSAIAK